MLIRERYEHFKLERSTGSLKVKQRYFYYCFYSSIAVGKGKCYFTHDGSITLRLLPQALAPLRVILFLEGKESSHISGWVLWRVFHLLTYTQSWTECSARVKDGIWNNNCPVLEQVTSVCLPTDFCFLIHLGCLFFLVAFRVFFCF